MKCTLLFSYKYVIKAWKPRYLPFEFPVYIILTFFPFEINSVTLLPLQIITVEMLVANPSYISILSWLQLAFAISKYKNVSLTLCLRERR